MTYPDRRRRIAERESPLRFARGQRRLVQRGGTPAQHPGSRVACNRADVLPRAAGAAIAVKRTVVYTSFVPPTFFAAASGPHRF
jgi:hypothetical protein